MPQLPHGQTHDNLLAENKETLHRMHQLFQKHLQNLVPASPVWSNQADWQGL